MKYRITVHFGPFSFSAACESVAAAFRHVEAIVLSPMYKREDREAICSAALMALADMENGKTLIRENSLFRMEVIREGRRRG